MLSQKPLSDTDKRDILKINLLEGAPCHNCSWVPHHGTWASFPSTYYCTKSTDVWIMTSLSVFSRPGWGYRFSSLFFSYFVIYIILTQWKRRVSKGSCQVESNPKIREKLGLVRPHPPTPLSNFSFALETFGNMKTTQKQQKTKKNLFCWGEFLINSFVKTLAKSVWFLRIGINDSRVCNSWYWCLNFLALTEPISNPQASA